METLPWQDLKPFIPVTAGEEERVDLGEGAVPVYRRELAGFKFRFSRRSSKLADLISDDLNNVSDYLECECS